MTTALTKRINIFFSLNLFQKPDREVICVLQARLMKALEYQSQLIIRA